MDSIINLNVGGQIYTTSLTTLTSSPASMLGRMFCGDQDLPSTRDLHGNYVIDRDGNLFRYILMFLRSARLILPENFQEVNMLLEEAEFFQIAELISAVKAYKDNLQLSPDVCMLNVGGTIYTVLVKYLFNKNAYNAPKFAGDYRLMLDQGTPYEQLTLGNIWETIKSKPNAMKDKQGNYVVDLDPSLFRYILNFVRTSRFNLPRDFAEFKQLQAEMDRIEMRISLKEFLYYQLVRESSDRELHLQYLDYAMNEYDPDEIADYIDEDQSVQVQERWPHAADLF